MTIFTYHLNGHEFGGPPKILTRQLEFWCFKVHKWHCTDSECDSKVGWNFKASEDNDSKCHKEIIIQIIVILIKSLFLSRVFEIKNDIFKQTFQNQLLDKKFQPTFASSETCFLLPKSTVAPRMLLKLTTIMKEVATAEEFSILPSENNDREIKK